MTDDSQVETFAALRFSIDSERWAGVPFYVRTGKCLPVTATEVLVEFKRPCCPVLDEIEPPLSNYFRFRLSPGRDDRVRHQDQNSRRGDGGRTNGAGGTAVLP